LSGDGPYTARCQGFLEQHLGAPKAVLTTSCTAALEMAALLLDLEPGDEVLVPSFTFVTTASAFALRGARPVFVDIRSDTLNLNEQALEQRLTPRTRAIVPVHYAGVGCEMDVVCAVARENGLAVVEDNAHGLFGKYKGRFLGTFGQMAAQSFHETKNVSCGEGGALLINDPDLGARAEIVSQKGTDRHAFLRGQVDKYTWVALGSSFLPSELQASFLTAQLEACEQIQRVRRLIWQNYAERLAPWAAAEGIGLPVVPAHCEQPYHMFYLVLRSLEHRTAFIEYMESRGVNCVFHFQPLHLSAMGRKHGSCPGDCPVTEDISNRLVRLPFYNDLSEDDQWRVIDTATGFR
jgi:dTDP-4-amino-4,6-dideoxygalactose transaminase